MPLQSLNQYRTDKELEEKGVWFDFGDFSILMARAGGSNKKYTQMLAKKMKPYIKQLQSAISSGNMPEHLREINNRILMETIAETVVLDWTLKDDYNEAIPCTFDEVIKIFKEYPDFFDECSNLCSNHSNYLESLREDMAKNL